MNISIGIHHGTQKKLISTYKHYSTWIICSFTCASVWFLFLFAFWPGILSYDSLSQLDQAIRNQYTDWHPVFHTLNIDILISLWNSPAIVTLTQILTLSIVSGYCLYIFEKKGVPKYIVGLVCLLFSLNLINGMMVITLWKDIPYSIFVLLLNVFVLLIIESQGKWLDSRKNWFLFGIIGGLISLYRYNGFPIPLITYVVLIIFFKKFWKETILSLITSLGLIIFFQIGIYPFLNIKEDSGQSVSIVFLHPIDAIISSNKLDLQNVLTREEIDYLNSIYPLSQQWDYSCYDATVFFYKGVNFSPIQKYPSRILDIFVKLASKNPRIIFDHFLCMSSFVWRLNQPDGVYLETVLYNNIDATRYQNWEIYQPLIKQQSKIPELKQVIVNLHDFSLKVDPERVSWRPAIYIYGMIIAVIILCLRKKSMHYGLILVPILVQSLIIMFVAQLEALRYQYPVYLVSMLFVVPLLYLPKKEKISDYNEGSCLYDFRKLTNRLNLKI